MKDFSSHPDCGGLRGKKDCAFICWEHQHWTCWSISSSSSSSFFFAISSSLSARNQHHHHNHHKNVTKCDKICNTIMLSEEKPVERENQRLPPTSKTTTSRSPPAPVKRKPIVSTFRQPGGESLLASNRQPSFRQPVSRQPVSRQPVSRQPVSRQPASRQPVSQQPLEARKPEVKVTTAPPAGPTLSLFDRIKARARGSSPAPTQSPRERAPSLFAEPSRDPPPSRGVPAPYQANSRFGVFDEVRLAVPGQKQAANSVQAFPAVPRGSSSRGQPQPYGEFQTVSLQG